MDLLGVGRCVVVGPCVTTEKVEIEIELLIWFQ